MEESQDKLFVVDSGFMDFFSVESSSLENGDDVEVPTKQYTNVEALLNDVSNDETSVQQESIHPIIEQTEVVVDVHPEPTRGRGRGRGTSGRGRGRGRGTSGRGKGVYRSQSVPSKKGKNNNSLNPDEIVSIPLEKEEVGKGQDLECNPHIIDQMLEESLKNNLENNRVKMSVLDQLKMQLHTCQSNSLQCLTAINQFAFSSVSLEKNQIYLNKMKNDLCKLTGEIASAFSDQFSSLEKMEDILASSIYKVNPNVFKRSFDPDVEKLSSRVIENGQKRKRENYLHDLCLESRQKFSRYLSPTIMKNGKIVKSDLARINNPSETFEVWNALYDCYGVLMRDEELFSLINFPFHSSHLDFQNWFKAKKREDLEYYEAAIRFLSTLVKKRYEAYKDFQNGKITDDVCEKLLKLDKCQIVSTLPAILKRG